MRTIRMSAAHWIDLSHFEQARTDILRKSNLIGAGQNPCLAGEKSMSGCERDASFARRRALKLLGAAATFAGLGTLPCASPAYAKSSQSSAAYRAAPNGRQRCANCSWFEPPSGCGVVRGPVSALGWCNLWG
jgi:hypothetical protein